MTIHHSGGRAMTLQTIEELQNHHVNDQESNHPDTLLQSKALLHRLFTVHSQNTSETSARGSRECAEWTRQQP